MSKRSHYPKWLADLMKSHHSINASTTKWLLAKGPETYVEKRTVTSTNDAEKTGYPQGVWNLTPISHFLQNQLTIDQRPVGNNTR